MDPVIIKATDLRIRTREIMERVKYKGEKFLIKTFGQPTAVIISVDEFEQLVSRAETAASRTSKVEDDKPLGMNQESEEDLR